MFSTDYGVRKNKRGSRHETLWRLLTENVKYVSYQGLTPSECIVQITVMPVNRIFHALPEP
jgi:hypothetical protein